ncbi:hypothetical protein AFL94_04995 [Arthrobacter sp. LS16]|nr:hypothetical protein AFL94_04995 [Arthrobacter sp. LS16]
MYDGAVVSASTALPPVPRAPSQPPPPERPERLPGPGRRASPSRSSWPTCLLPRKPDAQTACARPARRRTGSSVAPPQRALASGQRRW